MQNAEADSLFAEPANVIDMSTVNIYSEKLPCENSCSVEEIGGRNNTAAINYLRRNEYERSLRNPAYILHIEDIYNNISKSDIVVELCIMLPEYHKVSILTYIHNKDGKK